MLDFHRVQHTVNDTVRHNELHILLVISLEVVIVRIVLQRAFTLMGAYVK